MDIYLPIANLAVNGWVILALGLVTGALSGIFGVGGGFLTTPLLIFYGVPPTVAAASAASQVTGASVSGVLGHSRRGGVDYQMGGVMIFGGIIGAGIGAVLFNALTALGQIDTVINILYVVLLGTIGTLMARESIEGLTARRLGFRRKTQKRRHHRLVAALPYRWRFYKSGLYISPLAPLLLGLVIGILTMLMGVGGGFILVPAMLYILGMSAGVVVGTSLFQILFTTMATTIMHSLTTHAVDIVLATILLFGSVTGAQLGTRLAQNARPEVLRLALAAIVLAVALNMAFRLGVRPSEVYSAVPL